MTRRSPGYWTRRRILRALRTLALQLGRTPGAKDIAAADRLLCPDKGIICDRFGTIVRAQRAAKLALLHLGPQRKTHCRRGHPLCGDNVRVFRRRETRAGGRVVLAESRACRACNRERQREKYVPKRSWYRPEARVIPQRVARMHSPEALARHWGMAS